MTVADEQTGKPSSASTLKRAYLAMERMQRQIEEYERARTEPIAIVGLGCRFPGGVVDGDSYWDLLSKGTDAVREIPADRWDVDAYYDEQPRQPGKISTRCGGFLDRVDRFDHDFFGISRREALAMDPHQRLTLEVAWEALENAGQSPSELAGSRTGVFMGAATMDYVASRSGRPEDISAYTSSGSAHSFIPGRIAYLLDLRGPNLTIDTACSSSLVAVHQACQSLRTRECDLALSGGVNLVLSPMLLISLSQFGSVSPQGRAKTFSADADGYVRGEGCGIVVLKRLSDAVRDEDQVLAVLRGGAVNQDGRSSGVTAPNGAAQRELFTRALRASGIEPHEVSYVEAHGTGTKLGDPIEAEALAEVYGREEGAPLYLGSSKTNLGHLEAAAGIAGLIKVVLSLHHGEIPRNLHFGQLNPHISFDGTTFAVPVEQTPWPAPEGSRIAGVSSFGLSGTNVHLLVEDAPKRSAPAPDERRPRSVLPLSAKTETALLKLARRYQDRLRAGDDAALADLCYSAATGRAQHRHRIAVTGTGRRELAARLGDFVRGEPVDGLAEGEATGSDVVFLFTGQGAQRVGMARELYRTQPTFAAAIDRCAQILDSLLEYPLLELLYPDGDPGESAPLNQTAYAQPATFAVEYAMVELWRSWGVRPVAVIGHSLGEYVAACVAGAMSLEDGLALVVRRARLIQDHSLPGAMAAISAAPEEVAAQIAGHPDRIAIAAVNGPRNTTISGDRKLVEQVCATFTARGERAKPLHIASSGHSPLMEPVLAPLREAAGAVRFSTPAVPLVSNVTGELWPWDQAPDADYWCRHTREPVRFADGVRALRELGYRNFLEVGPAPTLTGLVGDALPAETDALLLPSLRPKAPDWEVLLGTVAQLWVRGVEIDWSGFDRDYPRSRVPLPTYPFDPVHCWQEPQHPGHGNPVSVPGQERRSTSDSGSRRAPGGSGAGRSRGRQSTLPAPEELLAMTAEDRVTALSSRFVLSVRAALGSNASADIGLDQLLAGLGLDSLMAVELRNEIQSRYGVSVSVAHFLEAATIRSVTEQVLAHLDSGARPIPLTEPAEPAIRRVERSVDRTEELLAMLENDEADRG